jgi:hypothetical protein
MKLDDKRWASAFIDAEGYIQFENVKYKRKRIEVVGTEFTPIRFLQKLFGGRIYKSKPRITATGKKAKPQEIWVALNETAYDVCKAVLPYLKIPRKKDVAKEIIKYYE